MRALTMSPRPRLMAAEARPSSAAGQVGPLRPARPRRGPVRSFNRSILTAQVRRMDPIRTGSPGSPV